MELLKARDEPPHGETGRCVDPQDTTCRWPSICLRTPRDTIECLTDLGCEQSTLWRRDHPAPVPAEQRLADPGFQGRDMTAYGAMREAKFGRGSGVAAGSRRHLENPKSVEWRQGSHIR